MSKRIRFAVVGLGHIAQAAVLPAFKNASEKCELTALISDDHEKLRKLSDMYKVKKTYSYEEYDDALQSKEFDAVYIALPNDMHADFALKAAKAGIHILCEKPMAPTAAECQQMIEAACANNVKLMVAYRLHFEKVNMTLVDLIKSGDLGEPKFFSSTFALQVKEGNIRTQSEHGGGPLYDIGIYCINACRYLFQDDPVKVTAFAVKSTDPRFSEIEETVAVVMEFPGAKLGTFACSFGAHDVSRYEVVGSKGKIIVDPAYEYVDKLAYELTIGEEWKAHKTVKHDQFAPELMHLAECILEEKNPIPSGIEGMKDIRIIEAIQKSIKTGEAIAIDEEIAQHRPDGSLIEEKPGFDKPKLIKVESASK